eukprot:2717215-Ditylum_brightwellii.AAC.1
MSQFTSYYKEDKEEVMAENKQKHVERNEVERTFEFETKIHRLSPVMSKNAQYLNTNILIHQGLSLTVTLVKSNRDGRSSCFNKTFAIGTKCIR